MQDIKTIREAITKNRGGFENADDAAIIRMWHLLDKELQTQYLKSIAPSKISPQAPKGIGSTKFPEDSGVSLRERKNNVAGS